jgi:uncharacterized protein (TIGR03067 family)
MKNTLLVTAAVLLIATDDPKGLQKEMESLQGVWVPVSAECHRIKFTAEQLNEVDWQGAGNLEITGEKFVWVFWGSHGKGTLKLDPTKKPKAMDLVNDNPATLAIYELGGDMLRVCFQMEDGKPRPQEFTSKNAFVIIAYKRAKKP